MPQTNSRGEEEFDPHNKPTEFSPNKGWDFNNPLAKHAPADTRQVPSLDSAGYFGDGMENELSKLTVRVTPSKIGEDLTPKSALDIQVGGGHYKNLPIQPVEYIQANKIPFMEGSAIKYLTRWRDKGGIEDLKKAKHFIDMLIEFEEKQNAKEDL